MLLHDYSTCFDICNAVELQNLLSLCFLARFLMPIVKGFRRFQSYVSSRQVVTKISNLVPGSNIQQSGWSSAAPVTSKTPTRKKIATADRRAMLETFVNKYRAMNLGKFPSPSIAQKEVGGHYYTIRKMLQEMEYNFKITSMEKKTKKQDTVSSGGISVKSSGSQEGSNSQITMDKELHEDALLESVTNLDTHFEVKKEVQPSISRGKNGNNNITRGNIHSIATESHEVPDHHAKEDESPLEDKFGFHDSDSKAEHQHDEIRNIVRDMSGRQQDEELREKSSSSSSSSSSSIWGNLKSLASGFINIWKKQ